MKFNEDETKAFTNLAQSRNGEVILGALKRRREQLITGWLSNNDAQHGAHMRGKTSEVTELIQFLESLSQSKE